MKQGLDIAIPLTGRLILVLAPEDLTLGLPLHTNLTTAVYRTPSSWSHHTIDITFERLGTENFLFMVEIYRGSDRLTFKYDYMGRRVEKRVYSGDILTSKTLYVYDGFKCVEELDGLAGNAVLRRHAWQPFDVGLDVILATTDAAGASYFLHDANKNVMQKTDAEGNLTEKYEYAPFGGNTGEARAGVGFSSEAFDAATDLDYYNYRYHSPKLGRWCSREPHGEQFGLNLYEICLNQVVNMIDNYGLYSWRENDNGTDTITVGKCEIVIFDGHGSDEDPHIFIFPNDRNICSAAGFTGCYSDITNGNIDYRYLLPGSPSLHDDVPVPSDEKTEQRRRLADGALKKSKLFCKRCCQTVKIIIHSNYGRGWSGIFEGKREASYSFDCKTGLVSRIGGKKRFTAFDTLLHVHE